MSFKLGPDLIAAHASSSIEEALNALTIAGDERFIFAALAIASVLSLGGDTRKRKAMGRLWVTMLSAAAIVHLAKRCVDQRRPDRTEAPLEGDGSKHAGEALGALPSGRVLNMGALASALSREAPLHRSLIWLCASAVAWTRVVVLAYWLSDVLSGLAIGAATDCLVRRIRRS